MTHQTPKVLFITKERKLYEQTEPTTTQQSLSSGLLNSAKFVSDMLNKKGIKACVVQVADNNAIDREVTLFKPTHVFIEALWVVPEKFEVLTKLHPHVKWIVRLHSDIPFVANEGPFADWVSRYLNYGPKVFINCNSKKMLHSLQYLLGAKYKTDKDIHGHIVDVSTQVFFLPNYYPVTWDFNKPHQEAKHHINIGCFGAIRPMKNQLIQAIAAIKFADSLDKALHFHINIGRTENNGSPVLKNIRNLFLNQPVHKLIEHDWMPHEDFIKVVRKMDLCMQVSFSETFNIVTADAVNENVPVVVSSEIPWVNDFFWADTDDIDSQVEKLKLAHSYAGVNLHALNKVNLNNYSNNSEKLWLDYLK